MFIRYQKMRPDAKTPARSHPHDAGLDLFSNEHAHIRPGERAIVGTGIAVDIQAGFVGLIHPRSGLASKHGITIVNAPGTVDAGYRGELKVVLLNTDRTLPFTVKAGERIAQLLIQRVELASMIEVEQFPGTTSRGLSGFGSTGGFGGEA